MGVAEQIAGSTARQAGIDARGENVRPLGSLDETGTEQTTCVGGYQSRKEFEIVSNSHPLWGVRR